MGTTTITLTELDVARMKAIGSGKLARLARAVRPEPPAGQSDIEDDSHMGTKPENDARVAGIAADRLRSLIERIENIESERKALGEDLKDLWQETKSAGFDVAVVRQVIKLRKRDMAEVEEERTLLEVYCAALGM